MLHWAGEISLPSPIWNVFARFFDNLLIIWMHIRIHLSFSARFTNVCIHMDKWDSHVDLTQQNVKDFIKTLLMYTSILHLSPSTLSSSPLTIAKLLSRMNARKQQQQRSDGSEPFCHDRRCNNVAQERERKKNLKWRSLQLIPFNYFNFRPVDL